MVYKNFKASHNYSIGDRKCAKSCCQLVSLNGFKGALGSVYALSCNDHASIIVMMIFSKRVYGLMVQCTVMNARKISNF